MMKRNYTEVATKAPESLVFYKSITDYIMINSAIYINGRLKIHIPTKKHLQHS